MVMAISAISTIVILALEAARAHAEGRRQVSGEAEKRHAEASASVASLEVGLGGDQRQRQRTRLQQQEGGEERFRLLLRDRQAGGGGGRGLNRDGAGLQDDLGRGHHMAVDIALHPQPFDRRTELDGTGAQLVTGQVHQDAALAAGLLLGVADVAHHGMPHRFVVVGAVDAGAVHALFDQKIDEERRGFFHMLCYFRIRGRLF